MDLKSSRTLVEALNRASIFLAENDKDPGLVRQYWLRAFDWDLTQLVRSLSEPVSDQDLLYFQKVIERIAKDEPLQYILGYEDFDGLRFKVSPATLIPREDTFGLVQQASAYISDNDKYNGCLLDIGTGSGIIAISMAKRFPHLKVIASDISSTALAVAKENGQTHCVQIDWYLSDLFDEIKGHTFDVILSNPPYIAQDEIKLMDESVIKFEPHQALFAEQDGLAIYQAIISQAKDFLNDQAFLGLEIGFRQAQAVMALLNQHFPGQKIWKQEDLAGHDRYVFMEYKKEEKR
ncbi:peptide chain release factor N(5)-glutamine methyltransferase [Vaginisenegalia massiliensis]|uniref:peptide chain release factor N(5)-glutamine methyltransferase n=1 Tax=Vaginisenegalia massiliensis TaxID=2058294 RepID=UPI0013DE4F21|nr:peptide chain release factor N(5)-glutamine methyltransferase [Vaginisenegalia massiliensis]